MTIDAPTDRSPVASGRARTRRHGQPSRPVRSYLLCLTLTLPLTVLWSLATPVMAAFDAPAHVTAAAAVVRGQLFPPAAPGPGGVSVLRIPSALAALDHVADCLPASDDAVPSQCPKAAPTTSATTTVTATTGRYPPLFYALVGWPTLLAHGSHAYRGITLAAAVINALFLALALWFLRSFGPSLLAPLGWVLALTPEVLYLAGSVNDSGLEISAAVAAWSGLAVIASRERPPASVVALTTLSLGVMILSRPASPAWAVVLLAVGAVVAGATRLRAYLRQRAMLTGVGVVAACALVAVAYRAAAGAPALLAVTLHRPHYTLGGAVALSLGDVPDLLQGTVGVFGATLLPVVGLIAWVAAFAVAVTGALVSARPRPARAAMALLAAVVVVPVVADTAEANHIGVWWQARDSLPFAVGIPILLLALAPDRALQLRPARRALGLVVAAALTAQGLVFAWVLHRYANGSGRSWNPSAYRWNPPGGAVALAVIFVLALAWQGGILSRWWRATPEVAD